MEVKEDLRESAAEQDERKNEKNKGNSVRGFAVLTMCAVLAMVISVGTKILPVSGNGKVYAASSGKMDSDEEVAVPTGIAGVVSGVSEAPSSGSTVTRIGSSCEQVIVGQRVKKVKKPLQIST